MAGRIEVVAHRGLNRRAPENTLAAAEACVALGLDYVEVDVRTSRDGVLHILHDPTVDRTTNGHGALVGLIARAGAARRSLVATYGQRILHSKKRQRGRIKVPGRQAGATCSTCSMPPAWRATAFSIASSPTWPRRCARSMATSP